MNLESDSFVLHQPGDVLAHTGIEVDGERLAAPVACAHGHVDRTPDLVERHEDIDVIHLPQSNVLIEEWAEVGAFQQDHRNARRPECRQQGG